MSGPPGGNGNFQQGSYNDGNTQMQFSSFNWSSSQQSTTPVQNQLPAPREEQQQQQQFPFPMLQAPDVNELHRSHFALHHASMQAGMNMMNSFNQQMPPLMPALQQPQPAQIQYAPPPQQQQIQYAPQPQQAQIQYAPQQQQALPPPPQQVQVQYVPQQQPQMEVGRRIQDLDDERFETERRSRDTQHKQMVAEAGKVQAELRQLHDSHSGSRKEIAAKDQQLDALRQQIEQMHGEKAAAEQRHSQTLADMAKVHASKPQPASAPAIDMAALQQMISEGQKDRISSTDIQKLIGDAVSKQLSGVAKASDIESAASRMERGLHGVPTGATAAELQQTVQQELANALQRVARHMPTQQQRLEAPPAQQEMPWQQQAPRFHTEYVVEELPDEDQRSKRGGSKQKQKASPPPPGSTASHATSGSASQQSANAYGSASQASISKKPKQLLAPVPEQQQGTALTEGALARSQPVVATASSSKSHQSKSRTSIAPTAENALTKVKPSKAPAEQGMPVQQSGSASSEAALVRSSKGPASASDPSQSQPPMRSKALEAPGAENALVRTKHSSQSSKGKTKEAQSVLEEHPPPQALSQAALSQLTSNRAADSRSSSGKSRASVAPTADNAMVRAKPHDSNASKSSQKMSTVSVQPSESNALVRPGHECSSVKPSGGSSKKSTVSVQPSASNAMVRPGVPQLTVSALAMQSGQSGSLSGQQGIDELPDDFPDNASQISTWQRNRSSGKADQGTSALVRPKHDKRGGQASSPLRQLESVAEGDEGSTAMVRQSKDLAKKSGR